MEVEEYPESFKRLDLNDDLFEKFCGEERVEFGKNYKKPPIIVSGCSYAYGHGLKKEETFSYLMSNLTQRPVFNFSLCGQDLLLSLQHAFSYIQEDENNKETLKKADYFVYVYMHDHINRFFSRDQIMNSYDRLFKPSKLEHKLIQFYLIRYILSLIRILPYLDKTEDWLEHVLLTAHNNVKNIAPNAKIIIVIYDEKLPDERFFEAYIANNSDVWEKYQAKTGDIVIHTKDLTGFIFDKNYKLKADTAGWHPNNKAWKIFTLLFVKKYITP